MSDPQSRPLLLWRPGAGALDNCSICNGCAACGLTSPLPTVSSITCACDLCCRHLGATDVNDANAITHMKPAGGGMNLATVRGILSVLSIAVLCVFAATAPARAQQAPAAERPQMAENVYKNIQVLRGIPADQFLETMGFMAASTGLNCTHCHGGYDYSGDTSARGHIDPNL